MFAGGRDSIHEDSIREAPSATRRKQLWTNRTCSATRLRSKPEWAKEEQATVLPLTGAWATK